MASTDHQPVQRRPGGRSARVRSAVLMAALAELAEGGYASFSCEAVAKRAGVHKTTVYRRWGNRENLLFDLFDAMLEAEDQPALPDTGSLHSDLAAYGATLLANVAAPAVEGAVRAIAATSDRDVVLAEASQRYWGKRFERDAEIVTRAIARGEVPPDTDPRIVLEAFTAPFFFRLLQSGEPPDEEFVEAVAGLVAAGVSTAPGSGRPVS